MSSPGLEINTHRPGNTVYLITGASNGIGAAFLPILLSRDNTTVIATHRITSSLPTLNPGDVKPTSALLAFYYDALFSAEKVLTLAQEIRTKHDISQIHVVLASAGMVEGMKPVADTEWSEVQKHLDVNFGGPFKLFQGLRSLLTPGNGQREPETGGQNRSGSKFILISSSVGSLSSPEEVPGCIAYGASKAAANYLIVRLNIEYAAQELTAVAIHPGWVRTRMGFHAAKEWGVDENIVPISAEDSASGVLKVVDGVTRANAGGKFLSYDGTEMKW